jgi:hypothetical protein
VVNQFLMQLASGPDGLPDEMLLVLGHVAPPYVTGTPKEQMEQLRGIDSLTVRPVAQVAMSRLRAGELLRILQESIDRWDDLHKTHEADQP